MKPMPVILLTKKKGDLLYTSLINPEGFPIEVPPRDLYTLDLIGAILVDITTTSSIKIEADRPSTLRRVKIVLSGGDVKVSILPEPQPVYAIAPSSMYPLHEHRTPEEGSKYKVHITTDGEKALCGFQHPSFATAFFSKVEVTKEWLDQPDPDNVLCKRCKKIAYKLLQK